MPPSKQSPKVLDNISIENAKIGFRNFSGKESRFNPVGRKNFCVFLDEEFGEKLMKDGWNIKYTRPRDEDDTPTPFLQVAVSFDNYPPRIVLITSRGQTILDSRTISVLDWSEIKNVDVIIRPHNWDVQGKGGVKAYVKSMYVTIEEDEFARKYSHVPQTEDPDFPNNED